MNNPPCIENHGLDSVIPNDGILMTTFVEAYHRVSGDLDALREGFALEPAQFHAAMAFYCTNKDQFDAEYQRILAERQHNLVEFLAKNKEKASWAELAGWWRGNETDEEINAMLEGIS